MPSTQNCQTLEIDGKRNQTSIKRELEILQLPYSNRNMGLLARKKSDHSVAPTNAVVVDRNGECTIMHNGNERLVKYGPSYK
ncbi:hypothetical protein [Duncaniella dubosii]|uniref:hypothetical protein n=1 Tax=Duncaniella dubosii TaxID=2518971 RepID=UPI003F674137